MTHRTYAIPSFQAIGLSLGAAACTPSIMGSWELVEVNGEDNSDSYTYQGCTITSSFNIDVEMDERDGDTVLGTFDLSYGYSFRGCAAYGYDDGSYSSGSDGDVEATSDDGEDWEVEIDPDDGDSFDMDCTVDEDELDCEDEDGNDFLFERA